MYGPKGIFVLKFLVLFNKDGITKIKPNIDDNIKTKRIDSGPKNNPTAVINFASPNPIASIFFIFL